LRNKAKGAAINSPKRTKSSINLHKSFNNLHKSTQESQEFEKVLGNGDTAARLKRHQTLDTDEPLRKKSTASKQKLSKKDSIGEVSNHRMTRPKKHSMISNEDVSRPTREQSKSTGKLPFAQEPTRNLKPTAQAKSRTTLEGKKKSIQFSNEIIDSSMAKPHAVTIDDYSRLQNDLEDIEMNSPGDDLQYMELMQR
jgi:hypothetical protein